MMHCKTNITFRISSDLQFRCSLLPIQLRRSLNLAVNMDIDLPYLCLSRKTCVAPDCPPTFQDKTRLFRKSLILGSAAFDTTIGTLSNKVDIPKNNWIRCAIEKICLSGCITTNNTLVNGPLPATAKFPLKATNYSPLHSLNKVRQTMEPAWESSCLW